MKIAVKYFFAFCLTATASSLAQAQNVEMADTFRSEGKIYVVVAIVLIVLTGLIIYLFMLDIKMNKIERMIQAKKQTKQHDKSF